jgi:hypothetical protein
MSKESRSQAQIFLDEHRELQDMKGRSKTWPQVKAASALSHRGQTFYIVAGDVLGGEEELYLDRLARGADPSAADHLARELFLELPEELQEIVRRDLLAQRGRHAE